MECVGIIGSGVYSDVFKVKIKEEFYAFKQCYKSPDIDFIFSVNELNIISRIHKHPNIVKIKSITNKGLQKRKKDPDQYSDPDRINFLLELGYCDLARYIRKTPKSLYRENLKKIMFDLVSGLEFMHSRNVIHRDIKPANVIIFHNSGSAADITAKFTDFGISKIHSSHGRNTPGAVTLSYRAPEIAQEAEYDSKSDVWSLGLVFMDMVLKDDIGIFDNADDDDGLLQLIKEWKQNKIIIDPCIKDCADLADLIEHMTVVDPAARFTARQCLEHNYFQDYRHLIPAHDQYKSEVDTLINYPDHPERATIEKYLLDHSDTIVKARLLFHAAVLLDDYLTAVQTGSLPQIPINLAFYCMQYLTLKIFNVLEYVPKFHKAIGVKLSKKEYQQIEKLEQEFVCNYKEGRFYVDTIIEYLPKDISLAAVKEMIRRYYRDTSLKGKTHRQVAETLLADPSFTSL